MRRVLLLALALVVGGPLVSPAGAEKPAIARPSVRIAGRVETRGLVFFVPVQAPAGAAAVGTAHNFPLEGLVESRQVGFSLARSQQFVAASKGFLVPPGRPFNEPGGSLPEDFVVYALEEPPTGVRLLELDTGDLPEPGDRVRLLGVPTGVPHDEDDVFGRVVSARADVIEVDLDVPYDLRSWGGAPVLSPESGRVVGVLQAHLPIGSTQRLMVAPVERLAASLRRPLEGGAGRPFASFADGGGRGARTASRTAPSTSGIAPPPPTPPQDVRPSRRVGSAADLPEPLIRSGPTEPTRIHLAIEYPSDGAVLGNPACGVFVAGRALAARGPLKRFDVVLVLDTSASTGNPTGADIDGDGKIGKPRLGGLGSVFDMGSTDPGDSILAAEVAAARTLLRGLDPRSTRVAVVTFAGDPPEMRGSLFGRMPRPAAFTSEPLTTDYRMVERALDDIAARDPQGATHMAAGVDQATIELVGLRGALSNPDPKSDKIVFFFTDGQPTLPYGVAYEADNVRAVLRAVGRARRGGVRIHSFAIGPDALSGPIATVEMAARTDGYFTPVRHPGDLANVVEQVSFANLSEVQLRSATTGEPADPFRTTADGSWSGLLKIGPGANRLEVVARADDGTEARQNIEVRFDESAPDQVVPPEFVVQRNRLLEECLRSMKEVRLQAEERKAEQVRKELMVEIEREREKARQRAEEQRKELRIEVEGDDQEP